MAVGEIMVMAIVISIILLFVGIAMLIFIHVCIVGRAFRRGFGNVLVPERGGATLATSGGASTGNTSMSKDDLENLPSFHYKTTEDTRSDEDCAVCLETFEMGDKCRLLPTCNHSFHAQCVDTWLLRTPFCPICRTGADSRKGSSRFSTDTRGDLSQTTESSSRLSDIRIDHGDDDDNDDVLTESESQRIEDSGAIIGSNGFSEENQTQSLGKMRELNVTCSVSGTKSEENQGESTRELLSVVICSVSGVESKEIQTSPTR
ncbi:putative RING-H2 finger protein ATL49 [Humulus lupulus]|uniref:putative RING-H2 finger protein ATL49 n=1 Tax=Humulus lupulus TaxID=3486 RepID=UPI002B417A38|nr:putative RING-H2 finger protein ATL49 [Humulus lupulus]